MLDKVRTRLVEIRERERAATPGPWWGADNLNQYGYAAVTQEGGDRGDIGEAYSVANAAFIAHSRADVPWLIAQFEQADRDRRALYPLVAFARGAGEVDSDGVCCWCQRTDCTTVSDSTCFGWQARRHLRRWEERGHAAQE
jgi:hypothetical protein